MTNFCDQWGVLVLSGKWANIHASLAQQEIKLSLEKYFHESGNETFHLKDECPFTIMQWKKTIFFILFPNFLYLLSTVGCNVIHSVELQYPYLPTLIHKVLPRESVPQANSIKKLNIFCRYAKLPPRYLALWLRL